MAWKMYKIATGHNSLENFELEADDVPTILHQLEYYFQERFNIGNKFGLEVLSSAAVEILIDGIRLTVGWDNWSGTFLMAWDADGDKIVREVGQFFGADQ